MRSSELEATHPFPTAIDWCEIRYAGASLTGFRLPGPEVIERSAPVPTWVEALAQRVRSHVEGRLEDFIDAPYAWEQVAPFARQVYQAALRVKPGRTSTYGGLAAALGQPVGVARAIGTALGRNPWPLLVPCHRFLGADGRMTGFSAPGGIKTKLRLLAIEGAEMFGEA